MPSRKKVRSDSLLEQEDAKSLVSTDLCVSFPRGNRVENVLGKLTDIQYLFDSFSGGSIST